jgi:uncharacterized membrane protein YfcA
MDLLTHTTMAALASGVVVGFLLTVFGGGGSVLATPLLLYFVGVSDTHLAIGTSAAAVTVNALLGLSAQARAGRVKWPCALVFGGAGLAGSVAGSTLAKQVDGRNLLLAFATAMAAVAVSMLWPRRDEGDPQVHLTPALAARLAPLGLAAGFAAGFFGIGGGFLIAPGLMAATGMTLANAQASSLVSVSLFGVATSANYAASSWVDGRLFLLMTAGGALGSMLGLPVAARMARRARIARPAFAGLILATAAYVAARASGWLA